MKRRKFINNAAGVGIGTTVFFQIPTAEAINPHPEVVDEFGAPTNEIGSIAFSDGHLWVGAHYQDPNLYKIDREGVIQDSFSIDAEHASVANFTGITELDGNLYAFGEENPNIVDDEFGEGVKVVIVEISHDGDRQNRYEIDGGPIERGFGALASDHEYLYLTVTREDVMRVLNTNANRRMADPVPEPEIDGMVYDGENFWVAGDEVLYYLTTDGEVIERYDYPVGYGGGAAHDGEYLYIISKDQNTILQLNPNVEFPEPNARFVVNPQSPTVNEIVRFDASETLHVDGVEMTYEWDLTGDGTVDTRSISPEIQYDEAGTYDVTLRVIDERGETDEVTKSVTIEVPQTQDQESDEADDTPDKNTEADDTPDKNTGDEEDAGGGTNDTDEDMPGFGVGGALAGLGGAGYLLKRRLDSEDKE